MIKCTVCDMDNLPPDHFISVLHMEKQIAYDKEQINKLNQNIIKSPTA